MTTVLPTTDSRTALARLLRWGRTEYAFHAFPFGQGVDYFWYRRPFDGRTPSVVHASRYTDEDFVTVETERGVWRCYSIDEALVFLAFAGVIPTAEAVA